MIGGTLERKPTPGGPKKPLWPTESTFDKCKKKATEWDENRKHRDRLNGFLMGGGTIDGGWFPYKRPPKGPSLGVKLKPEYKNH